MAEKRVVAATRRMERYARTLPEEKYVLRLYVTGATPASTRAIQNLKALCEGRLQGRYRLEVVDVFQHPKLAAGEQIVATPTLVKVLPPPIRRFIGDMSDLESKLLGLDLRALEKAAEKRTAARGAPFCEAPKKSRPE